MICPFHTMLEYTSHTGPNTGAASVPVQIDLSRANTAAEKFAKENLADFNERVLNGALSASAFVATVSPFLKEFVRAVCRPVPWWVRFVGEASVVAPPDRQQARTALKLIGFLVDSAERHSQTEKGQRGAAIAAIRGLDATMSILGHAAGMLPRSSAYTYWIWNPLEDGIAFTHNPGERAFRIAVRRINELNTQAADAMRQVAVLDEMPDSVSTLRLLATAENCLREVLVAYRELARKEDGEHILTPEYFTNQMRTFLTTYPVAGQTWSGPNAAFLAPQRAVDAFTGVLSDEFAAFIHCHEMAYLPDEERLSLTSDMARPSIPAQLCALGLDLAFSRVLEISEAELVEKMRALTPEYRRAFGAFFRVWRTSGQIRKLHRSFVAKWLEQPASKMSEVVKASLPVSPDKGTGDGSMKHLDDILKMVRENPRVTKLEAAFKATESDSPAIQDHPLRLMARSPQPTEMMAD